MNIRSAAVFAVGISLGMWMASGAIAADLTDVGFIDQADLANLPVFAAANKQLAAYKSQLDSQYNAQLRRARTDAEKQQVACKFQQELSDKQREIVGPLFQRAQLAIAAVSASRSLSIVVDKRIVIYGGQDITKDVETIFVGSQAIQPPAATPPPSEIGYVDQTVVKKLLKGSSDPDYYENLEQGQITGSLVQAGYGKLGEMEDLEIPKSLAMAGKEHKWGEWGDYSTFLKALLSKLVWDEGFDMEAAPELRGAFGSRPSIEFAIENYLNVKV